MNDSYPDNARGARVFAVWGHFAPELLCASIVAAIVVGLRPPPGALAITVPVALMLFVVASWLVMRQHDRRLCEQCVAGMPLNVAERAVRYRRRFWMAHTGSEPRFLIPYLAVLIGSNFAPGTVGRIGWAVVQASMIYLIISQVTHRRFQPWCPWCSAGGGGSKRDDVAPDPVLPDDRRLLV
jgi:hypothetical protein